MTDFKLRFKNYVLWNDKMFANVAIGDTREKTAIVHK
jgi:hypothetical protein